ncbi:MAG TPA: hypothetical protein VHK70_01710 [Burkholderiaceae bacterium]|nr:hypothetical protein [Burkholderiaceae bacterium]
MRAWRGTRSESSLATLTDNFRRRFQSLGIIALPTCLPDKQYAKKRLEIIEVFLLIAPGRVFTESATPAFLLCLAPADLIYAPHRPNSSTSKIHLELLFHIFLFVVHLFLKLVLPTLCKGHFQ